MSSYLYVNYTPVSTPIAVPAVRGAKNFIAEDVATGQQNISTSGAVVETVNQSIIVMVSFTLEAMLMGEDYEAWANFASWTLLGNSFLLAPNYPASLKEYPAVVGDPTGFKITRAGMQRYTGNFKIRLLAGSGAPANAGEVMDSFWGRV